MTYAEEYARWVLAQDNSKLTGKLIKAAARRFLSDLKRDDIYFDEEQGNAIIVFIEENLYHWEDKWRGTPVVLEPWQKFIFQQIYGWIVKDTGLRRIRMVFIEIAKKNSKTAMCAYMALYHLFADRINSPKVFVGSNNHEQANICTNYAGKTIEISPALYDYIEDNSVRLSKYNGNIFKVIHEERDGFIETMAKEPADPESKQAGGKHGKSPSLVIIDEYGLADSDSLLNAMENAQGAREEPMTACITTASPKKQGPCYQKLRDTGIKVLEGVLKDDAYLAFIYEMDKPTDTQGKEVDITAQYLIDNPQVWGQSNPNHKISVFDAFLKSQLTKAVNEGGTKMVDVLTFNFNVWVDSAEVFIPADVWNMNEHGIEMDDLEGQACYGGIEIVGGDYLNSFCLLFPDIDGKTVIKCLFWMPGSFRKNTDTDKWGEWADEGFITEYLGNVSDNDLVLEMLIEELSRYQMHSFAFKNNLKSNDLVQGLIKQGLEGNPISHGMQGISTPTLQWEKMLRGGEIEHFGNPVLRWMNSNCLAKRRENEVRIEKAGSRQVGIYAAINALAQSMSFQQTEQAILIFKG